MDLTIRPISPAHSAETVKIGDRLETAFLGEMLKLIIPDGAAGAFGGGAGESQFASFLADAQAEVMAARMDLGLGDRVGRDA